MLRVMRATLRGSAGPLPQVHPDKLPIDWDMGIVGGASGQTGTDERASVRRSVRSFATLQLVFVV